MKETIKLAASAIAFICATQTLATPHREAELEELLQRIDHKLYEESVSDIRNWVKARIAKYGDFRAYPYGGEGLFNAPSTKDGSAIAVDVAKLFFARGAFADGAAQIFRAYEMLGDKEFLEAGLAAADLFLDVQQPTGHFPMIVTVTRSKEVTFHDTASVRIQDGYQFRAFALLLYAYKLSGDKKYFEGAKRCADLILSIQNPLNGSCPDQHELSETKPKTTSGNRGVFVGGSYNDFATTDPMRMSVMMYHLTGETKYLERTAKIGQWMFDTQLGVGRPGFPFKVRGWCQQYGPKNEPIGARSFELPHINPRTFHRFVGPMLTWFFGMTANERYLRLLTESHLWYESIEHSDDDSRGGGWALNYLADGTEVFVTDGKTYRIDEPNTWPSGFQPRYYRSKFSLKESERILRILNRTGLEGLREWYRGPTKYTHEQYLDARIAAARRCLDEDLEVPLLFLGWTRFYPRDIGLHNPPKGKYLNRVRQRFMRPDAPWLPRQGARNRSGVDRQAWFSIHAPLSARYRPPFGWAQWQYVWDVRLARGDIDTDTAASGGRGLEAMRHYERWDVMGDWTTRAVEVGDWMDVPLAKFE